jgi:hypothetical protein
MKTSRKLAWGRGAKFRRRPSPSFQRKLESMVNFGNSAKGEQQDQDGSQLSLG